jgi:hypothetical protein
VLAVACWVVPHGPSVARVDYDNDNDNDNDDDNDSRSFSALDAGNHVLPV